MQKETLDEDSYPIMDRSISLMSVALHIIEIIVAVFVVFLVIYGGILLFEQIIKVHFIRVETFHATFEELLSDILLLIVGIEMAMLLIRRTPESLVEVMFFVIARKMLVKSETVVELLIGVVAIAGLFAVRKYLEHRAPERQRIWDLKPKPIAKSLSKKNK